MVCVSRREFAMSKTQSWVTNDPDFKKEYDTLKRKHAIPEGEKLKKMLSTEDGRKRHEERSARWAAFKKKWNIVFMIGDKPVLRTPKK